MATVETITGRILLPNNTPPVNGVIKFVLSGMDTDTGEVIAPYEVSFALEADGDLPAGCAIYRNSDGLRGTIYRVYVLHSLVDAFGSAAVRREVQLGNIQINNAGPHLISSLLNSGAPTVPGSYIMTISQTQYDAAIAAAASATASAAQAALYDGIWFNTVANFVADTVLSYTSGAGKTLVAAGDYVLIRNPPIALKILAVGALSPDYTTAGAVKASLMTAASLTPNYSTLAAAVAAKIPTDAVAVKVSEDLYLKTSSPYAPTHEYQFTDQLSRIWVKAEYLRINDRMPIVVIATGQSNLLGISGGNGGDIGSQPMVYSYERHPTGAQTTGWKLGFKLSPDYPTGQDGNHFPYHFCARLARETNRPVVMIPYAIGGMDVAEWLPAGGGLAGATGTMWTNLLSAWAQALTVALPFRSDGKTLTDLGLVTADYLLWHQGEENRDSTATYPTGSQARQFKRDLGRVFNAFLNPASASSIADPLTRTSTVILMGDLPYAGADGVDNRNPELYQFAAEVSGVSIAKIGWLPKAADNVHFDPKHIERIADFYYDLIGGANTVNSWDVTIGVDALYEFRPAHLAGSYDVIETKGSSGLRVQFSYRVPSGAGQCTAWSDLTGTNIQVLSNVDLATLSNTSTAFLGISAMSGRLQFRNRKSGSITLRITPYARQPLPTNGVAE